MKKRSQPERKQNRPQGMRRARAEGQWRVGSELDDGFGVALMEAAEGGKDSLIKRAKT